MHRRHFRGIPWKQVIAKFIFMNHAFEMLISHVHSMLTTNTNLHIYVLAACTGWHLIASVLFYFFLAIFEPHTNVSQLVYWQCCVVMYVTLFSRIIQMARFVPVKSPGVFNVPVYRELRAWKKGLLHIKVTGVRLLAHHIKGLSMTSFLQKKSGSLGDGSPKTQKGDCHWVWNCTKSEQFQIFAVICKIKCFKNWWFRWKILIVKAKRGGHWVWSCEKGGLLTGAWCIMTTGSAPWATDVSIWHGMLHTNVCYYLVRDHIWIANDLFCSEVSTLPDNCFSS